MNAEREPTYLEPIAQRIYHLSGGEDSWYPPDELVLWLGYAVLCLSKGVNTKSRDVHDVWSMWSLNHSVATGTFIHRSVIPFDELAPEVQAYDDEYRDAIHQVARELSFRRLLEFDLAAMRGEVQE